MPTKKTSPQLDRRKFLATAAIAGAAGSVPPATAALAAAPTSPQPEPQSAPRLPSALPPNARVAAAESGTPQAPASSSENGPPGSDFMVDVIKSLDIKYLPANPAASYRGLHESLINYGKNTMPEFLTCMHEESGVAMCHGYFKATGKPLMTLVHGVVGLQHATMAVYNAWCDRVPVLIVGGNDMDAAHRAPGVPTFHSAQDINAIVRDFTKWDDTPVSLQHFAESFVRMYKIATTPPYGPVMMSLDEGLQNDSVRNFGRPLYVPKFFAAAPPQGDLAAVKEAARLLANAEHPVIVVDRAARTQNGVDLLIELAELLQAPVVNQGNRMNFPST
ncbi:MAG TPA: thiamine pyrophosphate-binding protein, partial [Xanthobacteraceae bacterium]|nr:thiamine pyrophosphate-binding protein [Xanthobacteraceae bacterium]